MRMGDRFRFRDAEGGGTVIALLPGGKAMVRDDHGLEYPVSVKAIVIIAERAEGTPALAERPKPTPQPAPAPVAKPCLPPPHEDEALPEIALAFLLDPGTAPETGDMTLWFLNSSGYDMLVNIAAAHQREYYSLMHGKVDDGGQEQVCRLRRQDVTGFGPLLVDCVFFRANTGYTPRSSFSATVRVRVAKFIRPGSYQRIPRLGGRALVLEVEEERPSSPQHTAIVSVRPASPVKPAAPEENPEFDLHIETLTEEHARMSDHEKFLFQMRSFESRLDKAMASGCLTVTFIHGIGSGKLRQAIRDRLVELGLGFSDGPFHRYGAGATEVRLA